MEKSPTRSPGGGSTSHGGTWLICFDLFTLAGPPRVLSRTNRCTNASLTGAGSKSAFPCGGVVRGISAGLCSLAADWRTDWPLSSLFFSRQALAKAKAGQGGSDSSYKRGGEGAQPHDKFNAKG